MNDLKSFRADMPPADPETLARARARMFHAPAAQRPRRRWVWGLAPVGALAAAVAVAAVAVSREDATPPAPSSDLTEAAQVLRLAAAEARREPELTARPDQFVYVESRVAWAGSVASPDTTATYRPPVEKLRRVWLSVDGSRAGLLKLRPVKGGEWQTFPLSNEDAPDVPLPPAYRRDLPTDVTAMRAYLYSDSTGKPDLSADTRAFTKVGDTLREQYVPPRSVAALFEAAATIPETALKKGVDLSGRKGVAVSRVEHGTRYDLIFDASSHRYLGERTVVIGDVPPFPKDAVIGWTAQLEVAVVDRPGQLP